MEPLSQPQPPLDGRKTRIKRVKNRYRVPEGLREKMSSPEMLAKRMEGLKRWYEANPGRVGRPKGLQDGVKYSVYKKRLAAAKIFSEKALIAMEETGIWKADNDKAASAMKTAIEVMQSQQGTTQTRLAAAKLILDFTQTKPVVKNETTLKSAEEFLSALIAEEKDGSKP